MSIASRKSHRKKRKSIATKSRTVNSAKNKQKKKEKAYTVSEKNRRLRTLKKQRSRIVRNEVRLKKEKSRGQKLAKNIFTFLGEEIIEQAAISSGFLIRKAKIVPYAFLIAVSFGAFGNGSKSHTGVATTLLAWFGIKVTAQAVSDRLGKIETVKFFKIILEKVLNWQLQLACKNHYADLFTLVKGVKIEDSTRIELHKKVKGKFKGSGGGASKSAIKINYCYDITNYSASHIDVVSGIKPDQALANDIVKKMKKGELIIRDLGFFSLEAIAGLIKKEVFFLSRASKQTHFFLNAEDEQPININDFLKNKLKNSENIDCELYVGQLMRIKVRLIAEKVPKEVQNQRAKRFKKERKKEPSEDYIIWSGFSVFITNIPTEMYSPKIIISVYKIRWQIELFFRSIKSTLKIHILKGEKENRVLCMIYAKLISILVALPVISYAESICEEDEELSVDKTIKWLQEDNRFGVAIAKRSLSKVFKDMLSDFHALCKDKRIKRPSTYKTIKKSMDEESMQAVA